MEWISKILLVLKQHISGWFARWGDAATSNQHATISYIAGKESNTLKEFCFMSYKITNILHLALSKENTYSRPVITFDLYLNFSTFFQMGPVFASIKWEDFSMLPADSPSGALTPGDEQFPPHSKVCPTCHLQDVKITGESFLT